MGAIESQMQEMSLNNDNVGTWNIGGFDKTKRQPDGTLKVWGNKRTDVGDYLNRYKLFICGISETRLQATSVQNYAELPESCAVFYVDDYVSDYRMYYSLVAENRKGVAVLVKKGAEDKIDGKHCGSANDGRIIYIRLCNLLNKRSMTVVQVYAPIQGERSERESFFADLGTVLNQIPREDFILMMGDFNSWIGGPDSTADTISGLGDSMRNPRTSSGSEFITFCQQNELCIINTQSSPGQPTHFNKLYKKWSLIDYIVVRIVDRVSLTDTSVIPKPDPPNPPDEDFCMNFDHCLLVAKLNY